jgi:undecaprenol kinase
MELRKNKKKPGFIRFLNSFKYSFEGLGYAFTHEQSTLIMLIAAIVTVVGGIYFRINEVEWLAVFFAIGIVLATELINTSIEATIDLLSPKFHPLAKIAKDTGSAAVFVFTIIAVIIGLIVFVPYVMNLFK